MESLNVLIVWKQIENCILAIHVLHKFVFSKCLINSFSNE